MQAMSIDMNEEATPANTSSTLGSRQNCASIHENNLLDADEDVVDGLRIDTTASGIPAFHDSGTPGNPIDDTGGIIAYVYEINYSAANLTVDAEEYMNPAVNILYKNAGSSIFNGSDPVPDVNSDNVYYSAKLDTSVSVPEDGSGVLDRLTLVTETGAATGSYQLILLNHSHIDAQGTAHPPASTNNDAYVAVNTTCGDFDGDGVLDPDDDCVTYPGPAANDGCPLPGAPAVGGTAGLIQETNDTTNRSTILALSGIAATAAIVSLAGGALVRRLVARRARR
jgi:hypothetical protein